MGKYRCIDRPSGEVLSIKVRVEIDEHPDLSWLGEYTDNLPYKLDLRRGDAFERRHRERHTYKYFTPAMTVGEHRRGLSKLGYSRGVAEELARYYCRRDFERMEGYNRGDWWMVGIWAEAAVVIHNVVQTISSGGLWGVESDAGRDYHLEVANEEVASLRAILETLDLVPADFAERIEEALVGID